MHVTVHFNSINTVVTESKDGNMVPIISLHFLTHSAKAERQHMTFHSWCYNYTLIAFVA